MFVVNQIKNALGINDLEKRVSRLEGIIPALEGDVGQLVSDLGNYKEKTKVELKNIIEELGYALAIIKSTRDTVIDQDLKKRAKLLSRKLLNNQTRAKNALRDFN